MNGRRLSTSTGKNFFLSKRIDDESKLKSVLMKLLYVLFTGIIGILWV